MLSKGVPRGRAMISSKNANPFAPSRGPVALSLTVLIFYAVLVSSGLHQAYLGSQFHYLWDNGIRLSEWYSARPAGVFDVNGGTLVVTEAHRLRYALSYPLFLLADATTVSVDRLFSMTVPIAAAGAVWAISSTVVAVSGKRLTPFGIVALLPLAALFVFMDGRLIYAIFGYCVLIWVMLGNHGLSLTAVLLGATFGLLFTSVSSGTQFSATLAILFLCVAAYRRARGLEARLVALAPAFYVILLFHYDLHTATAKNISYYEGGLGGLLNALSHGFGRILLVQSQGPYLIGGIIIGGFSACTFLVLVIRRGANVRMIGLITLAVGTGAFGYSALSLAIVPVTLWAACWLNQAGRFGVIATLGR
jgi:hypothetical protein